MCVPSAQDDFWCVYLLAFYFAVTTLTTVGYGDISPQNKVEYGVAVVSMLCVGYVWAFIVGTTVSILSNLDPATDEFKQNLDDIAELSRRRRLPRDLQVRLRSYVHETRHFTHITRQRDLIQRCLSAGLQREVVQRSAAVQGMLRSVVWMQHLSHNVVLDIVRVLVPEAYGPQEHIQMIGNMILMQRGVAAVRGGHMISRGDVWGQYDVLLVTRILIDWFSPLTFSFVELLKLGREDLIRVSGDHPEADRRLRRVQIRTAVFRAFIWQARHMGSPQPFTSTGSDHGSDRRLCSIQRDRRDSHGDENIDLPLLSRTVANVVLRQEQCHTQYMEEFSEVKQALAALGGRSASKTKLSTGVGEAIGSAARGARRALGRKEVSEEMEVQPAACAPHDETGPPSGMQPLPSDALDDMEQSGSSPVWASVSASVELQRSRSHGLTSRRATFSSESLRSNSQLGA